MSEIDLKNLQNYMNLGTKDLLNSSKKLFDLNKPLNQNPSHKFATSLEILIEKSPEYAPIMEQTLDKSTDSVRSFIKSASQMFGKISLNLQSI